MELQLELAQLFRYVLVWQVKWSSGNIIAAVPKNVFCFLLIPSIGYWEHGQETPNFAWEKECSVP